MRHGPTITPLDVLENFFGETPAEKAVLSMTRARFQDLRDRVNEFASAVAFTPAPESATYCGGWLGGNWTQQILRGDLSLSLLYYPRLLVHDPLSEFFFDSWHKVPEFRPLRARDGSMSVSAGPDLWARAGSYDSFGDNIDGARKHLASLVGSLGAMAPLLRSGVVVARPQWPVILQRSHALVTSVRHDVRDDAMGWVATAAAASGDPLPSWDTLKGMDVIPTVGLASQDEPWRWQYAFFYLAKTLAFSEAAGCQYAPPSDAELKLLQTKAEQLLGGPPVAGRPTRVLREVARVLVPDMQLSIDDAVRMRDSEEAFDEWRRALRRLSVDAEADSDERLRERVEDTLTPIVNRSRRAVNGSTHLKGTLKEQAATTIITTTVGATTGALSGGNPILIGAGGAASGVLQWLWKALHPPTLGGVDAVVASLVRSPR